jgi:iron complex outermembrane receptor protein
METNLGTRSSTDKAWRHRMSAGQFAPGGIHRCGLGLILCWSGLAGVANAQTGAAADLVDMSLSDLVNMKITSVSREEKSLSRAAAAVFVIRQEDIQRSGLNSIPELLRMVPGLDVARIDGNKWAITARGFNERFADKMLVQIDGRSILSSLSSSVYWDVQDLMLEDIERIEVVLGPGATLWGANAVNGVIDIITKKARQTQGTLVTVQTSGEEAGSAAVRHGGRLGSSGYYRVFVKNSGSDALTDDAGHSSSDSSRLIHGGFRGDWKNARHDDISLWADLYGGSAGQTVDGILSLHPAAVGTFNDRTSILGGNLQGLWHHASSQRFDTTVLSYFTSESRNQTGILDYERNTLDTEIVQHLAAGSRNDLIWGSDYRMDTDRTTGSVNISYDPANRTTNLFGVFLQDEIVLAADRLWLTLGSKLEHNSYSGFALQPNVRLLWTFLPRHSIWAAISQAAENSSRSDADIRTNNTAYAGPGGVTVVEADFGTHVLPADKAAAFESGYRVRMGERVIFDASGFYNRYWNRHAHEPGTPFLEGTPDSPDLVIPTAVRSDISGESHGFEISASLKMSKNWKVITGYTFLQVHLHTVPGSQDISTVPDTEGNSPHHEFQVRSLFNVSRNVRFDSALYFVGTLPGAQVERYARVDVRLAWKLSPALEFSAGGQNLLDPRHYEFDSGDLVNASQIGRTAFAKLTLRY